MSYTSPESLKLSVSSKSLLKLYPASPGVQLWKEGEVSQDALAISFSRQL